MYLDNILSGSVSSFIFVSKALFFSKEFKISSSHIYQSFPLLILFFVSSLPQDHKSIPLYFFLSIPLYFLLRTQYF